MKPYSSRYGVTRINPVYVRKLWEYVKPILKYWEVCTRENNCIYFFTVFLFGKVA